MSNKKLNLKIITPSKVVVKTEADAVYSKAIDGEFGVMPDHIPFMTALDIGITKYTLDNKIEFVATIGGIFQVIGNDVVILTDSAELGEEIDIPRARAAKERAEARLGTGIQDVDASRAQAALTRALIRMQAASRSGR